MDGGTAVERTAEHAEHTEARPRRAAEHHFASWDGTALFYRAWLPARPADRPTDRAAILLHRGHEHSGRMAELAAQLDLPDFALFAWDARGHGRSPGERGAAPDFSCYARDLDAFVRHIAVRHGIAVENIAVVAASVGAVVAAAWVHDYAPPIRALVLATPALRVKLYLPFAIPLLRLWSRLKPNAVVQSYVGPRLLTHDVVEIEAYRRDPLITRAISAPILVGLQDTARRLIEDAGAITVPTLLLAAGADRVVRLEPQRRFFARLGATVKRMEVFPGFFHALFHERDRQQPIALARDFISQAFAQEATPPVASTATSAPDRLAAPLPFFSPERLCFALQRLGLRTIGRLSQGVRLGWRHGFDSGPMLDYVYENRARGVGPLGRLIDRLYLDSPGWRGIRQRRHDLQDLLRTTLADQFAGRPVRIVDIAAGPGRYLIELLEELRGQDIAAELRDRDPAGLAAGRALAAERGLANVRYVAGDAFDAASLATIAPRPDIAPNIAIVSGLYELFADNAMVQRSLAGLADILPEGGFLLYTNQPWHPQLEFIARVLVNREGKPWVMRCRSQAEMDELVRAAGFEKIAMRIDPAGIFTVSLARKRSRT